MYFQIQKWTKVCSRHFREYDFIKTLSGRRDLRSNAVTSLFPWIRTFFRTISPGGGGTFISQLYTGSISDREIVVRSGLLDLPFQEKDSIMADKGFTIQDLLPLGVSLNIPPFLGSSAQMPANDVVRSQEIASLRIHVERAINKIKNFHIWDGVVPLHQFGVVNQMWVVCAILCNAQSNIISI